VRPPAPQPAAGTVTERLPPTNSSGLRRAGRATVSTPPSLHWGILDFACVLTCGIFGWCGVHSSCVGKKSASESKALLYTGSRGMFVLMFGGRVMAGVQGQAAAGREPVFLLFRLGVHHVLVAAFNMRSSIEEHSIQP